MSDGESALGRHWAAALIGLLALGGVVAWLAVGSPAPEGGPQRPPYVLPVTLSAVSKRDVLPVVNLTGTVRPARATLLAFEVAGVVSSVDVLAGDSVRAGQVVARLNARDLELEVGAKVAGLLLAERELSELKAGVRAEERERLGAELVIAQASETLARLELERARLLEKNDALTQGELDQREAGLTVARGRVAAAKSQLAAAQAGPRREDVEVARARSAQALAALDIARRNLEKAVISAPWAGAVQRHGVTAGGYVEPGQMVSVLVDDRYLEVEVEIPSRFAGRLGERPKVRLTSDLDPEWLIETQLDTRLPAANEVSRNVTGVVRLWRKADGGLDESRYPKLQPGMFLRVELSLEPLRGQLVVPPDSIRVTKAGPLVVRALPGEGGKLSAEWIRVRVLGSDSAGTAILSLGAPLAAGDRIVLTGVDLAFPGVALNPRPATREATKGPMSGPSPVATKKPGEKGS